MSRKRSIIETMIGRFKNFFGENLSRFRSSQSAYSAICAAIIAVNLAPSF
ncbi:MAG: transposase [Puniceicoccales bacterium]|nr:transposase [Puniceicoccales bacterium]